MWSLPLGCDFVTFYRDSCSGWCVVWIRRILIMNEDIIMEFKASVYGLLTVAIAASLET